MAGKQRDCEGRPATKALFPFPTDTGTTFNDISLIDTKITNAEDVAVPVDASKVYLVTDDGTDTSVWYGTSSGWTRVLSLKGLTDFIIRTERLTGSVGIGTKRRTRLLTIIAVPAPHNGKAASPQYQSRTSPWKAHPFYMYWTPAAG